MPISHFTTLSKPNGAEQIPVGTFGYLRARNKRRVYDLVIKEFKRSGLSQVDLARRLGKGTDRVCKILAGPGNWTLDTVSDLLFAISGGVSVYQIDYPLNKPTRNYRGAIDRNSQIDALSLATSNFGIANTAPISNALSGQQLPNSNSQNQSHLAL